MNVTCNSSWNIIQGNSTLELNESASSDYSACKDLVQSGTPRTDPYAAFYTFAFGSSIFIIIASVTTILANSFLLLAFFVDPLKIFRNPTTIFLIGLAIVDLLTALVNEPIYATCFMLLYFQSPLRKKCIPFMDFGRYFGASTMTVSFLIVFAFTLTQYVVVSSPLKYARLVTKKKVLISVMVIYLYSATFWCLPLMGVPQNLEHMIDLFVHNYVLVLTTIAIYILLHRLMKKKMAAGNSLQGRAKAESSKHDEVQRNFVRVNFILLAVLIMCAMPSAVMWTIHMFKEDTSAPSVNVFIGNLMVDNLLYLKFLFDPFVYAWRMMKYREAFYKSFCRKKTEKNSKEKHSHDTTREGQEVVEISTITSSVSAPPSGSMVTLLSFKGLEE